MQVTANPAGRLIWASAALPRSSHDLTAARTHGIIDALSTANVMTFADKAKMAHLIIIPRGAAAENCLPDWHDRMLTKVIGGAE
jgi:hypothetical protein